MVAAQFVYMDNLTCSYSTTMFDLMRKIFERIREKYDVKVKLHQVKVNI